MTRHISRLQKQNRNRYRIIAKKIFESRDHMEEEEWVPAKVPQLAREDAEAALAIMEESKKTNR